MIPRQIHRIWVDSDEPAWSRQFAKSWHQPGWDVTTWYGVPPEIAPLRNQDLYDGATVIAPDHVGQLRSDILRLELLYHFGGVYVDADFECLRPLDPLLDGAECFVAWEVPDRFVNNAIFGATPGHPFVEALIDGIESNVQTFLGSKPNKLTGPRYVSRVYHRGFKGVHVFDKELFYPYLWNELDRADEDFAAQGAYAVHHWANKRRERGEALAA